MSNVALITPHLRQVQAPAAIRDLPAWLIWRFEENHDGGKPRKVPYYAGGGKRGAHGTAQDVAKLVTFDAAARAAARMGFDGVGFATLGQFGICALDFDDCITDGRLHPDVEALLVDTYAEYSPSGRGVRLFFRGNLGNGKALNGGPYGMECFSSKGYVTYTGNTLELTELLGNTDEVAPVNQAVVELYNKRFARSPVDDVQRMDATNEALGMDEARIREALALIDPSTLHYDDWLRVGMAVHAETAGAGFDLWDAWSSTSSKYTSREYGEDRWRSFGRNDGAAVTGGTLLKMAGLSMSSPASADEFPDALEEPTEGKPLRFPWYSSEDFSDQPLPTWVIKGVLPQADLAVLYGASGAGKSFVALDMVAAIARGTEWRGRRVKQGRVAYIAAEGAGGFRKRVKAYKQHFEVDQLGVNVIPAAPNLVEKGDAIDIIRTIRDMGGADIVVVDTFAQVTPGSNENAGEDMGTALANCRLINKHTGAMVLLIHHAGKDLSKGARGWSGIKAAADAELEVAREGEGRVLRLTKSKDGEDMTEWGFDLEVVQLGVDEDMDPITSCVVVEAAVPAKGGISTRKLGPVEKVVNEVIQEVAQVQTSGIEVNFVVGEAVSRLDAPEEGKRDTRRQRVRRAIEALCSGDDAPYWLQDDGTLSVC